MEKILNYAKTIFKASLVVSISLIVLNLILLFLNNFEFFSKESSGALEKILEIFEYLLAAIFLMLSLFLILSPLAVWIQKRRISKESQGRFKETGGENISANHFAALFLIAVGALINSLAMGLVFFISPIQTTFSCDILSLQYIKGVSESAFLSSPSLEKWASFSLLLALVSGVLSRFAFPFFIKFEWIKGSLINKFIRVSLNIAILTSIVAILFYSFLSPARKEGADSRRVSDMKAVSLALNHYKDANASGYPVVLGDTPLERWANLRHILAPEWVPELPDDPCFSKISDHQYDYTVSSDGELYVIRAILVDPNHSALKTDIDGEFLGADCGNEGRELEYCLSY